MTAPPRLQLRERHPFFSCDLCGTEKPRTELRRLGKTPVTGEDLPVRKPEITGRTCDVCPECAGRPVSELLAIHDEDEDLQPRVVQIRLKRP